MLADSSLKAILDSCFAIRDVHSPLGESALSTSHPPCCVAWSDHRLGFDPVRARLQLFRCQADVAQHGKPTRRHSCRLSGGSFVDSPLLDHKISYATEELSCPVESEQIQSLTSTMHW